MQSYQWWAFTAEGQIELIVGFVSFKGWVAPMVGQEIDLQFLLELALDKSLEARHRLAAQISDLASKRDAPLSERERDLITEILNKLLRQFELPVRLELSQRLSRKADAPQDLVVTLANDQIEVARPLLMNSGLLRDPELIEIIRHRGQQHQLAIARRHSVSEVVAEVLVETDDEDVIKTLLENENAQISQDTMAYLVEESKRVDSFQEPLVQRNDLNADMARRIYWWVAAALRHEIIKSYDIHPAELDDELEDMVPRIVELDAHQERMEDALPPAAQLARSLSDRQPITSQLLIKALRQGEVALFEALFGEWSQLRAPRLGRVLYHSGGEGLAIACRALSMTKQDFATILMLTRSNGHMLRPEELYRATSIFDAVEPENAEQVLATWRRLPDYLDAIEGISDDGRRQSFEVRL